MIKTFIAALKQFETFTPYEQISTVFGLCLGLLTALGIVVAIGYKVFIVWDKRRARKEKFKAFVYNLERDLKASLYKVEMIQGEQGQRLQMHADHFNVNDDNINRASNRADKAQDIALYALRKKD